jgi:DNA polymerase-3 subunit beta
MKLSAARDLLSKPLQAVMGVVERRQTMPILSNVRLVAEDGRLSVTATDLEVELVAHAEVNIESPGAITVSGRKLLDICGALPEGSEIDISLAGDKLTVKSGRSKFTLATLPADEFPTVEDIQAGQLIEIDQEALKRLIDRTCFSMAQQDVRYYLNGMLLATGGQHLRAVATDGHRLALCELELAGEALEERQVIVPRKGVLELQKLMTGEGALKIELGSNHIRIQLEHILFTSKLIDGRFPEYERVIPKESSNLVTANREALRDALKRMKILSNEKFHGIRLMIRDSGVTMRAHNPEQEEAEEELDVGYSGEDIEIGFNVKYLLDALDATQSEEVTLSVQDSGSSCLIREPGKEDSKFVVMPMRL